MFLCNLLVHVVSSFASASVRYATSMYSSIVARDITRLATDSEITETRKLRVSANLASPLVLLSYIPPEKCE